MLIVDTCSLMVSVKILIEDASLGGSPERGPQMISREKEVFLEETIIPRVGFTTTEAFLRDYSR